jgi:hypothetical protein
VRRRRRGGIAEVIGVILMVAITVILMITIYLIRFPLPNPPPTVSYASSNDVKYPVWGDPTDCYPNTATLTIKGVLENWQYFLLNGTGNTTDRNRWTFYMDEWGIECDNNNVNLDNGTYNVMSAARIIITGVSQAIPLSAIQFQFTCVNLTPRYSATTLVAGQLDTMEWVPGGSQNLSAHAPTLGTCATYDPRGSGANSVYYNRLGFFDPLSTSQLYLSPGMTLVIYVHTPGSILEAPNSIETTNCPPTSNTSTCPWGLPDADDYHGAPLWCFTVPGSCTVTLVDTDWHPATVIMTAPVYML